MKSFEVPIHYRSLLFSAIKKQRKAADKMKKDFEPTVLELGSLKITLARHFGFCYGVENAIEIAFKAIAENQGKPIYLLSEMIHNPGVNADLLAAGVRFLMDTTGKMLINWSTLNPSDIVIIPAFGTTLEIEKKLREIGIEPSTYETTCPFVEKVWNRAEKIGKEGYTIIVHGKPKHEETRATFSHSQVHTPTLVINNMQEAEHLAQFINGTKKNAAFYKEFSGQYSEGFDVEKDLIKIGVVNQTTMLASETQAISNYLKKVIQHKYQLSEETLNNHFADTRDTLCYATNDNQTAVVKMLNSKADFALVIGGYNSSNTSHLVELCEEKLPTYFINHEDCLLDNNTINHFDLHQHKVVVSNSYLKENATNNILITSGASCPDALVERVIARLAKLTNNEAAWENLLQEWKEV